MFCHCMVCLTVQECIRLSFGPFYTSHYSLMRGRIKGPCPLVNPMQSDKTFITWVIKILHGNGAPKATNLLLATRMRLPAATICSALTAAVYKIR